MTELNTDTQLLVTLRDGSNEPKALTLLTMKSLRMILSENPIALFEAVMIARDPNHSPFGNMGEVLVDWAILTQKLGRYTMHDSVRNVINNASVGEGFQTRLQSPLAKD